MISLLFDSKGCGVVVFLYNLHCKFYTILCYHISAFLVTLPRVRISLFVHNSARKAVHKLHFVLSLHPYNVP